MYTETKGCVVKCDDLTTVGGSCILDRKGNPQTKIHLKRFFQPMFCGCVFWRHMRKSMLFRI
jgi:hypothetical protein